MRLLFKGKHPLASFAKLPAEPGLQSQRLLLHLPE
jgi:hypothetical protein